VIPHFLTAAVEDVGLLGDKHTDERTDVIAAVRRRPNPSTHRVDLALARMNGK
jgi:hypothetical protein